MPCSTTEPNPFIMGELKQIVTTDSGRHSALSRNTALLVWLLLTNVWQFKIFLLYDIACFGQNPNDKSIQMFTYIKVITGHLGLYINRNNGQS